MTYILGISSFYHDSAVAIIKNGKILNAVQEERFTRIKHDANFPYESVKFVLSENNINLCDIDYVVFYDKPFLKFERLLETYLSNIPKGFNSFKIAMPIWLKEKLFLKSLLTQNLKKIDKNFDQRKLNFVEHHLSHAASAFYPSPFDEAIIITLDGVGEWTTSSVCIGKNKKLNIIKEIHFPDSLGLLYSAFTFYLGFKVNSGEYKIMGLAPYGKPIYKDLILQNLIDVKLDGSFHLNQKYFDYVVGLKMINSNFEKLFGKKTRKPESEKLEQFHMDVASSIQCVLELIVLKIIKNVFSEHNISNLCMAGGVALNCVANGKILNSQTFKNLWIQPASGDAGGALGAALYMWHHELRKKREVSFPDNMNGSYLGKEYTNHEIEIELKSIGANYQKFDDNSLIDFISDAIIKNKAIGWFQGRMEFGPRALGGRSILGNAMSQETQKTLNLKVKYRESFRPFAPAILQEDLNKYFDINTPSPYMLLVANIKDNIKINMTENEKELFGIAKLNAKRSKLPAITHVDYSARIQTVTKNTNPRFYDLLLSLKKKSGYGVVVNTSFNVRGEPIVSSPSDAFKCFMGTDLDVLCIGNYILTKKNQKKHLNISYKNNFSLD